MRFGYSIGLLLAAVMIGLTSCASAQTPESEAVMINPLTVERTGRPNDALACPEGQCQTEADQTAAVFDVPASELFAAWLATVLAQPRTTISSDDGETLLMNAEQRSSVFGFVDTIAAKVLPVDESRSTIAVYSRSNVGYWDLGVNKSRVRDWLDALAARVDASAG